MAKVKSKKKFKLRSDKKPWRRGKKIYEGIYAKRKGERVFELVPLGQPHGNKHGRYPFNSWQLAVKGGFKRCK